MAALSPNKRVWFDISKEDTSNPRRRTRMDTEDEFKGTETGIKTKRERVTPVPRAAKMNSPAFGKDVRVLDPSTPDTSY